MITAHVHWATWRLQKRVDKTIRDKTIRMSFTNQIGWYASQANRRKRITVFSKRGIFPPLFSPWPFCRVFFWRASFGWCFFGAPHRKQSVTSGTSTCANVPTRYVPYMPVIVLRRIQNKRQTRPRTTMNVLGTYIVFVKISMCSWKHTMKHKD